MTIGLLLSYDANHQHVVSISIFVAVLCLSVVSGHCFSQSRWTSESAIAILIGCIAGMGILLFSRGKSSHILMFDAELFFTYLLPPIIFNAGFGMKKKQFFHNFITIMLLGGTGVFISTAIIVAGCWWLFPKIGFNGLGIREYLALGAIFSSTDTVCILHVLSQDQTPRLYSLLFGEGVVNDATAVVFFKVFRKINVSKIGGGVAFHVLWDFLWLFLASTAFGVAIGLLTALTLKTFYFGRHSTNREVALLMLMAYLSYVLAELLTLSVILTVFFCGILMSHYAWYNITEHSRVTTRHILSTLSFIAETFIFLYVGMDVFDIEKWKMIDMSVKKIFGLNFILFILVGLGRAAFVFPLCSLSNFISSDAERSMLTLKHQVIIWWAGLTRGAVSIALAYKQFTISGVTWNPLHSTMITSTISIVLFTNLVLGIFTKPLVSLLTHQTQNNNEQQDTFPKEELILPLLSSDKDSTSSSFVLVRRSLSALMETLVHTIHFYWRKFDDACMRPFFGGLAVPVWEPSE
ncbi:hypothetical protein HPP92_022803 [Vanilla planifolia]|uniref:Cation/H+ exchanger transmembrane domain-containing protein n=1 Tax=Vanilla planifolia TaxID=51239 RepID=A0A835UFN5_VANPL|nr:hypothetical protein HPP92_022803 [Vanilla planifolia]